MAFFRLTPSANKLARSGHKKKHQHNVLVSLVLWLFTVGGEDEIRTRGTLIRYVGLANRWFQPLTHLSVFPFSVVLFRKGVQI